MSECEQSFPLELYVAALGNGHIFSVLPEVISVVFVKPVVLIGLMAILERPHCGSISDGKCSLSCRLFFGFSRFVILGRVPVGESDCVSGSGRYLRLISGLGSSRHRSKQALSVSFRATIPLSKRQVAQPLDAV